VKTPAAYPPSRTSSTPTVRGVRAWAAIAAATSAGPAAPDGTANDSAKGGWHCARAPSAAVNVTGPASPATECDTGSP
jgi:hypothetical protein